MIQSWSSRIFEGNTGRLWCETIGQQSIIVTKGLEYVALLFSLLIACKSSWMSSRYAFRCDDAHLTSL